MKHSPLAILAIVLLGAPSRAQQAPEPVPWVDVDTSEGGPSRIRTIDLVALDDSHFIGIYQLMGDRDSSAGTRVIRSTDAGLTWTRTQTLPDVRDATLAWDGEQLWVVATREGRPTVLRSSDARAGHFHEPARLRGEDRMIAVPTAAVHGGRVWRAFRRALALDCAQVNAQVLVGSAKLGTDLCDPDMWRWSGERAAECIEASRYGSPMRFVVQGDALSLTVEAADHAAPLSVLDVSADGWTLTKRSTLPPWKHLPDGADRFDGVQSWFRAIGVESTGESVTNVLTLVRSPDLETWQCPVLLHDPREGPIGFDRGTVRVVGDDLVILFAYRTDHRRDIHAGYIAPSTLAFLRVPKYVERKTSDAPMWGPRLPR